MQEIKTITPRIEQGWKNALSSEFSNPYFATLKEFLLEEKTKYTLYPPGSLLFNAFERTPFNRVKVVILGKIHTMARDKPMDYVFLFPKGLRFLLH